MPFGFNFTARHLSASEVVTDLLHGQGENIMVAAAIVKSKSKLTEDIFLKALKKLIYFQPALRMKIASETTFLEKIPAKRFVEMSKVERSISITEGVDRKAWLDIVEMEMTQPLVSAKGPLWKIRYMEFANEAEVPVASSGGHMAPTHQRPKVKSKYSVMRLGTSVSFRIEKGMPSTIERDVNHVNEGVIIFKIHQVIADEVSLFDMLQNQFIPLVSSLLVAGDFQSMSVPLYMIPSAEESLEKKRRLSRHQKRLIKKRSTRKLKTLQSEESTSQTKSWLQSGSEGTEIRPMACVLPFAVKGVISKNLCQCCQDHNVRLLSTVLTAAAISLSIQARKDRLRVPEELCLNFPIDLRQFRRSSNSPQPLGMWRGHGQVKVTPFRGMVSTDRFWHEVKDMDANVKSSLGNPCELFRLQKAALKRLPKTRDPATLALLAPGHIEVSVFDHLNQLPIASSSKRTKKKSKEKERSDVVALEEIYFMRSMSDLSNVPLSLGMCVFKESLMCTVTYNAKWTKRSFATDFVDVFLRLLHDVVSEADC